MFEHVRAVFFDIDDTLYDFKASLRDSILRFRTTHPDVLGTLSEEEIVARYWDANRSIPDDVKRELIHRDVTEYRHAIWLAFLSRVGHDGGDAVARDLAETWARDHYSRLTVFPGALETARALRARGVDVGIITNGPAALQRAKIRGLGLDRISDPALIFVSGEVGHDKPAPEIFQAALDVVEHAAEACLMVGNDAETDLYAKALGYRTAHFTPCTRGSVANHPWPPDVSVATYKELGRFLGLP